MPKNTTTEKEEALQLKANTAIAEYGNTPEVRKFLVACGLNLAIMMANKDEDDIGDPEMEFNINGAKVILSLA